MPDTDAKAHRTAPKPDLQVVHSDPGLDLPFFGHVAYRTVGVYGGLAVAGTVGVLEWPVAAAVGAVYALARR